MTLKASIHAGFRGLSGTTTQLGPVTQQVCDNSDGTRSVQSCLNAGPSIGVGGVSIGGQVNACSGRSIR